MFLFGGLEVNQISAVPFLHKYLFRGEEAVLSPNPFASN